MKILMAAALLAAASFTTLAVASGTDPVAGKPTGEATANAAAVVADALVPTGAPTETSNDARTVASDAEVGVARRAYRAQCSRYESASFCECVTAGVAQALSPADVRVAARTIRDRITAQGDAVAASSSDPALTGSDQMTRIEQAESHYVDACSQFRGRG